MDDSEQALDDGKESTIETVIEISEEEIKRLIEIPKLTEFQRNKLDKDAKKNWDLFYKRNGDRFFKRRYWTRREFAELFTDDNLLDHPKTILEIGCGCGDFALTLIHSQPSREPSMEDEQSSRNIFVFCCDISDRAISILTQSPVYLKNHPERIKAFTADITKDVQSVQNHLDGREINVVSLIFVLSAIDPLKLESAISNIYKLIAPGGLVLFRDYAIYDAAMMRFSGKSQSKICDRFYVRQDGTRAYFFEKEELVILFENQGFKTHSIDYVRRETVNHATKDRYTRMFLQARFIKESTPR